MARNANGRRIYALADYTVKRTSKGWYFGRTSRFSDVHTMKGPYSSERSVASDRARTPQRDRQTRFQSKALRMTGGFLRTFTGLFARLEACSA